MKYLISATRGPTHPSPEQFDGALEWLQEKLDDGTFDCLYSYLEGGGFSIANADSHSDALELMAEYPPFALVSWEVRPLLQFPEGDDLVRAKLAEVQAANEGG